MFSRMAGVDGLHTYRGFPHDYCSALRRSRVGFGFLNITVLRDLYRGDIFDGAQLVEAVCYKQGGREFDSR
jgi:hypothetical protein